MEFFTNPGELAETHFLREVEFECTPIGESTSRGEGTITPALCVPGTAVPRIAPLVTFVDIVAGCPPTGPLNPTVDLRLHLHRRPAMRTIRIEGRTLKHGRTLYTAETLLWADDDDEPFGVGMATFMAWPIVSALKRREGKPTMAVPLDERVGLRRVDARTVELARHRDITNGLGGTIQGGLIALLGEIGAEGVLGAGEGGGDRWGVHDIDVRYLGPVKTGPARARSEVVARTGRRAVVRTEVVDAGEDDRIVSHMLTVLRPLSAG